MSLTSKKTRNRWQAIRGAIKEMDEGEGVPKEDLVERAAILTPCREEVIHEELEEMEKRGEVYRVGERYKDTNAAINGAYQ